MHQLASMLSLREEDLIFADQEQLNDVGIPKPMMDQDAAVALILVDDDNNILSKQEYDKRQQELSALI